MHDVLGIVFVGVQCVFFYAYLSYLIVLYTFLLQMAGILGMQDVNSDMMSTKLDEMMGTIRQVNEQFKNAASLKEILFLLYFIFVL